VTQASATGESGLLSSPMDRRTFLRGAGALAGTFVITHYTDRFRRPDRTGNPSLPAPKRRSALEPGNPLFSDSDISFFIQVERDTDLALIDFVFYNFEVGPDPRVAGQQAILPIPGVDSNTNSVLLVRFPPQAIGEGVYPLSDIQPKKPVPVPNPNPTGLAFDPPPILSAVSGPSQLAFTFNAANNDYVSLPTGTMDDLLDPGQWAGWNLSVPEVAQVHAAVPLPPNYYPVPQAPSAFDTYVEFPYAMYLAPTQWSDPYNPENPDLGYATVFENNSLLDNTTNISDIFTTSIVLRTFPATAPTVPPGEPNYFTDNELDQPLPFAALWCDDLSLNPVVYKAPYPSVPSPPYAAPFGPSPKGNVLPSYNPDYDVTYWTRIQYGEPPN
jgi:hypothetical protein